MLVHAATAPAAVLRTLPSLPAALHAPSLAAGWAATAAVTAAYSPAEAHPRVRPANPVDPASTMDRAVHSGDAHAIKFADAAVDAHRHRADPALLAAADHATRLIDAD
jgi:hypothetical protein